MWTFRLRKVSFVALCLNVSFPFVSFLLSNIKVSSRVDSCHSRLFVSNLWWTTAFFEAKCSSGGLIQRINFKIKQTPLLAFLILCSCQNFLMKIAYSISCSSHGLHQFLMITSIGFNFIINWMKIFSWYLYYTICSHEVEQQILKFSIQQEHHFCIHYFTAASYLFWNIFCIYIILHINYLWNWESMEKFKCRIS